MHGVNCSHSNDIKISLIAAAHLNATLISFVFKKRFQETVHFLEAGKSAASFSK